MLSPTRYEIFAGLMDFGESLGEAAQFSKIIGELYVIVEEDIAEPTNPFKEAPFEGVFHCAACNSRTVSSATFVGNEFSTLTLSSA